MVRLECKCEQTKTKYRLSDDLKEKKKENERKKNTHRFYLVLPKTQQHKRETTAKKHINKQRDREEKKETHMQQFFMYLRSIHKRACFFVFIIQHSMCLLPCGLLDRD